jgi:hypothetical protein
VVGESSWVLEPLGAGTWWEDFCCWVDSESEAVDSESLLDCLSCGSSHASSVSLVQDCVAKPCEIQ